MTDTKRRRLADQLIGDIRNGRYQPGDKLPSLRALREEWGESTVLAAMRLLVAEGWARAVVGAGTFVADPLPTSDSEPLTLEGLDRRLRVVEAALQEPPSQGGGEPPRP